MMLGKGWATAVGLEKKVVLTPTRFELAHLRIGMFMVYHSA